MKKYTAQQLDTSYEILLMRVKESFNSALANDTKLFTTNVTDLADIYLDRIQEDLRQQYNCRTCKDFINRFGGLVTINEKGQIKSVMWDFEAPIGFEDSVEKMRKKVEGSKVTGMFFSEKNTLGQPLAGEWNHLSVKLPSSMVLRSRLQSEYQVQAEKKEEFGMLLRGVLTFSQEVAEQALSLLQSETLYRADRCVGIAEWFVGVHESIATAKSSRDRDHILWRYVATAPRGFCHIKSSMIGSLLEDIAEGLSFPMIKTRFEEKMNPNNYMRSQSAPSANSIKEAEKMIEKLGVANSLPRRYATLEEIPECLWKKKAHNHTDKGNTAPTGVFSHLVPKENKEAGVDMTLPVKVMTWEKFQKTVLPTADSMEAKVDDINRLMALVTAQDPTAPNILQWNNTFSWYYHGGVDAEIRRRVEGAGGKYEGNTIRCSLMWNNYTDLDIHCLTPNRDHIYFSNKRISCGYLDVDANAGGGNTMTPVENIRFDHKAPEGIYRFYVHNFSDRNGSKNPFKAELEVNGHIFTVEGDCGRTETKKPLFEVEYIKGQAPRLIKSLTETAGSTDSEWTVRQNEFVAVKAITTSPNLWGDAPKEHLGNHTFFILDGCKDESEGCGRGFFTEMLQADLRQIRKTLEAYTASAPIDGVENATACGLGFVKDREWNLTLKVKTKGQTRLIKIDRWD